MRFEKKLIFGVGINDWNTPVRKDGKLIKEYYLWSGVIQRCYSETFQKRQPAYKGVTCSEDWLTLSNFERIFKGKPILISVLMNVGSWTKTFFLKETSITQMKLHVLYLPQ